MKKYHYKITGIDCASCAHEIETMLKKRGDLFNVSLNFSLEKLSFESEKEDLSKTLLKEMKKIEPSVSLEQDEEQGFLLDVLRLFLGSLFFLCSFLISSKLLSFLLVLLSYLILVYPTLKKAYFNLLSKTINENFLITFSSFGALLIQKNKEGFMVLFLYGIGKLLEKKAIRKSRNSIQELMDLQVDEVIVKKKEGYEVLSKEEVSVGSVILVKKGEKVPLDGILLDLYTEVDAKSLTGESSYQVIRKGEEILSGCINVKEAILIKTTKTYQESTVSCILDLIENAGEKKSEAETFVTKVSEIYTPIVLLLAILIALFYPVFTGDNFIQGFYHSLVFVVISCPCSIAISIPLAYFTGIGVLSRNGILVKGSTYLDRIREMKRIIFDKTGTLTTGVFQIAEIYNMENISKKEVLFYIGLGESFSTHPIAVAIQKEISFKLPVSEVSSFKEEAGKGISYHYQGKKICIGNEKWIKPKKKYKGTVLYLSIDGIENGAIVLEDKIKENAKNVIENLKKQQIDSYMFTGDKKEVAKKVGETLGIQYVEAELLPKEKYQLLEKILSDHEITAFVGDGINDSPSLRRCDLGISMGGIGSAAAIEASDIVLMDDQLSKIPRMIQIANYIHKIVVQNLVFALGIKIGTLILSLFGIVSMWQAVFADVGVTLLTILNTFRILKWVSVKK